jgi:hypothetical protein
LIHVSLILTGDGASRRASLSIEQARIAVKYIDDCRGRTAVLRCVSFGVPVVDALREYYAGVVPRIVAVIRIVADGVPNLVETRIASESKQIGGFPGQKPGDPEVSISV